MSQLHTPHTVAHFIHSVSADYRLRLPPIYRHLTLIGTLGLLAAVVIRVALPDSGGLALAVLVLGLVLLLPAGLVWLIVSRLQRIRFRVRDQIVNAVQWRGDERVLDVGTGSGILLFGCAKRLTTGKGVGIDIYQPNAGGGTAETFRKNAHIEGLENRVELHNVDARQMPFEDASFDVIVSSAALHHVGNSAEREKALNEMLRVLKPGGTIALFDIASMIDHAEGFLRRSGITSIQRTGNVARTIIGRK